ncbi:hypothetical protein SAMD00019534_100540 [Acytostelium subglobosum LB1]|uniref:hypothetical protein n=1 Tax=Acytostelium subglobosum LB1 TaxID=1410327 RepID=UPI0006449485|nr:hypothetical protein SAMD00019534_100540 [Acytostelium subglobosum LB1]GAM26879.1 hypothetical protein SAMD00019534_100540 [Acytostelium subglobosum LB1]|eukprot:XP_012750147.1 hypothetical protein SAMD00019534_100540 [Acytostelium subglobosum LB1]
MDINLTFIENRAIRVAILPIGDISLDSFRHYSNLIKTLAIIELSGITRDAKESRVLEKINWVDGHMLLNFLDSTTPPTSEWEDIHVHKRVFGVIGVVDCKRAKDLTETKRLFDLAIAPYKSAVATVCYAFDPLDEQADFEPGKFVMIPNAGDQKHLLFYLNTLLFDFSLTLLRHFEKMVVEPESQTRQSYISTPLESVISWDEVSRAKKRKPGRLAKVKGDYCLLAGSPLDAIKFYDISVELSKSNNDYEWIAASYESQISAILSKRNQEYHSHTQSINMPAPTNVPATTEHNELEDQHILTMAAEAISSYNRKKALNFEIELTIKLANYHASMERKAEASELLTSAVDLSFGLTLQEKIMIICSCALAYFSMGFKRKFAFFVREAAFLHNKRPETWEKINNLLQITTRYFQLEDLFGGSTTKFLEERNKTYNYSATTVSSHAASSKTRSSRSRGNSKQGSKPMPPGLPATANGRSSVAWHTRMPPVCTARRKEGWFILQRYLIYNLISVSSNLQDSHSICNINTNVHMNILGFPFLLSVKPLPPSDHLAPHTRKIEHNPQKDNFFIYSPYEQRNADKVPRKQLLWVEGECSVVVTLSNPLAFDVLIQSIQLSTAGVPFECYPLSFKVLSCTEKMEMIITGRALKPGPLIIKGVFIRSYNLLSEHPINQQGEAISLSEYEELIRQDAYKVELDAPVVSSEDDQAINKITVVPKMPLLNVTVESFGGLMSLFVGEQHNFNLVFENIGTEPIEEITLLLGELDKSQRKSLQAPPPKNVSFDDDSDTPLFQWDNKRVQSALPILPGQSFTLPVHCQGRPYCIGNQLTINYNRLGEQHLYHRRTIVPLQMDLNFGPEITNFDIVYTSLNSLKQLESFIIGSTKPNIPSTVLATASPRLPAAAATTTVASIVEQSHQLDIYNDYCLLVFEIKNNSSTHSFSITSRSSFNAQCEISLDTTFNLAPNSSMNIYVPVRREPFPDALPPIRLPKGQYIKPKKKLTEHQEYLNRLNQYYKDMIINNVKLTWISVRYRL